MAPRFRHGGDRPPPSNAAEVKARVSSLVDEIRANLDALELEIKAWDEDDDGLDAFGGDDEARHA